MPTLSKGTERGISRRGMTFAVKRALSKVVSAAWCCIILVCIFCCDRVCSCRATSRLVMRSSCFDSRSSVSDFQGSIRSIWPSRVEMSASSSEIEEIACSVRSARFSDASRRSLASQGAGGGGVNGVCQFSGEGLQQQLGTMPFKGPVRAPAPSSGGGGGGSAGPGAAVLPCAGTQGV